MKPILIVACLGAILLLAIMLFSEGGEIVAPQPKSAVADIKKSPLRVSGNDRNHSNGDGGQHHRNGDNNASDQRNGDATPGEELPWLDPQDTFEKRIQELEKAIATKTVENHVIACVKSIIPDGLTISEKYLRKIDKDFPDTKRNRVRADARESVAVIIRDRRGSEYWWLIGQYAMDALDLLSAVALPEDYEFFQQYFMTYRDATYGEGDRLIALMALEAMVKLEPAKAKTWVTGILSDAGDSGYGRSMRGFALGLVREHYRSEDFIPYIRAIAANHPRPPEIVFDKGQEDIIYQVQLKDTLWTIAEKFYDGRRDLSTVIAEANKETLTGKWGKWDRPLPPKVGQTLRIPRLTKETITGMSVHEFDGLYNSMLETLEAIGTDEARRLIDEIRNSEALRHRQDRR